MHDVGKGKERCHPLQKSGVVSGFETIFDILEGSFLTMPELSEFAEPEALILALRAGRAKSWWDSAEASYRHGVLQWIAEAKRAGTKDKRITTVVDHCIRGEKIPNR